MEERKKRLRARAALNHHLRDKHLSRPNCEVCGEKAEAHHYKGYDYPLEVKWLCFIHHRKEHGQLIYENPELLKGDK